MKMYKNHLIRHFNFRKGDRSKLFINFQLIMWLSITFAFTAKAEKIVDVPVDMENTVVIKEAMIKSEPKSSVTENILQERVVTGTVTDSDGNVLSGVSVELKGRPQAGTTTDENGTYVLTVPQNAILVFSYIGNLSQEINVGIQKQVNVKMEIDMASLDEVVVVGYGSQSKRKISTAISKVSGAELNHLPVPNAASALSGLAAGVQVQAGSGDTPGAVPTIRIRGIGSLGASNTPLYVVDGYPLQDASHFSRISVSDIESIEVLKDAASASIYGSRAANGVVIVTTKRGTAGKTSFNVNAYTGLQQVYRKMEMMNKEEYIQYAKDARKAGQLNYPDVFNTPEQLANTDWQDEIFQRAPMSEIQLSAQGGNDKIQFSFSGTALSQDGTIKGSGYQLASARTNLDASLSDKLKFGANFAPSIAIQDILPAPGTSFGVVSYAPVYAALLMPPVVSARLPNDDYGQNNVMPFTQYGFAETGIHSPLAVVELYENRRNTLSLFNNMYLSWEPLPGLLLRTQGGATVASVNQRSYTPSTLAYSTSPFANLSTPSLAGVQSEVSSGRNVDWVWENTVNYTKSIRDAHNFSGLFLFSLQKTNNDLTSTRGRIGTFTNDLISNPTAAADQIGSLSYGLSSFMSYALRLNYDYKDKYIFTGSVRTDASSRFGPNNRFGVFQSYAVAWRLIEESFMQSQQLFSELKIRASYGETGNANIGDNTWMSNIVSQNYSLNDGRVPGTLQQGFQNENLTWEKNRQVNLGLETGLLNNRVYLTMDIYRKVTRDMLFSKELPGLVGYASTFYTNIGKLKNEGIEVDITSKNLTGALKWNTSLNLSFNRTKVLDLGGVQSLNTQVGTSGWPNVYKVEVGKPLGNMYGFIIDGVIRNNAELESQPQWPGSGIGSFQMRDVDSNGLLNEDDRTLLGNGIPDAVYGITNNFAYKNFDLSFILQGVLGSHIINGAGRHTELWAGRFNAVKELVNNYFDPTQPDRDVKFGSVGSRSGFSTAGQLSNYAVYSGSFLRMRNLTLGHNFTEKVVRNLRLQSARIYLTAQNLFTISKYPGFNPEPSQYGESVYQPGSDQGTYPANSSFMIGINVGF